MRNIVTAALLLLTAACARVVAPSGGPEDTEPPEMLLVMPEAGFTDTLPSRIVIEFSEKIIADAEAVLVYPGDAEVTVKNNRIEIIPDASQGVLSVSLSGNILDTRNNRTAEPVTLVWYTVPRSDFAAVRATVARSGGGSVTESARCDFFLMPDTSSPSLTRYPDSTGGFTAQWLSEGNYLLICYEDLDRSRSWDPEREAGVERELSLAAGDSVNISLNMTIVDSIGPLIASVEALDGWHLEIQWNEQVSSGGMAVEMVGIQAPDSSFLEVYGLSASAGRSSTGRTTVYTARMQDTLYTVTVTGIFDLAGNPSLPDTLEFWGMDSLPDQRFGLQSAYPEDGGYDVPPEGPFMISFTDWVFLDNLDSLYSVVMVSDGTPVAGSILRNSPTSFSFYPELELLGDRQYRVDLDSGLVSLQGDTLGGRSWTFKPAWSRRPGSLSGNITGISAQVVTLVVSSAGGGENRITGEFTPGKYLLEGIPGGRYTAACFVDWNTNGLWDPGEPYGAWPGVVEVFPGLETLEINIQVVP